MVESWRFNITFSYFSLLKRLDIKFKTFHFSAQSWQLPPTHPYHATFLSYPGGCKNALVLQYWASSLNC
jgi:hypothetical protein